MRLKRGVGEVTHCAAIHLLSSELKPGSSNCHSICQFKTELEKHHTLMLRSRPLSAATGKDDVMPDFCAD